MNCVSKVNQLFWVVLLLLSVGLYSCGGGKKAQTTAKDPKKPKETVKTDIKKTEKEAKETVKKPVDATKAKTDTTAAVAGSEAEFKVIEEKDRWGTDSLETVKNYSLYREFFKQGAYEDAFPYWRYVYKNAPSARKTPLMNGVQMYTKLLDQQIEAAVCGDGTEKPVEGKVKKSICKRKSNGGFKEWKIKDQAAFDAAFDTILMLYKVRENYFGEKGYLTTRKARLYDTYKPGDKEKIKKLREDAVLQEAEYASYDMVYAHFNDRLVDLKEGNISQDTMYQIYDYLADVVDFNADTSNNSKYADRYVKYGDKMANKIDLLRQADAEYEDTLRILEEQRLITEEKRKIAEEKRKAYDEAVAASEAYKKDSIEYATKKAKFDQVNAEIAKFEQATAEMEAYKKQQKEYEQKQKKIAERLAKAKADKDANDAKREEYEAALKEQQEYEAKIKQAQDYQKQLQQQQGLYAQQDAAHQKTLEEYKKRQEQYQKDLKEAAERQEQALKDAEEAKKRRKIVVERQNALDSGAFDAKPKRTASRSSIKTCADAKNKYTDYKNNIQSAKYLYASLQRLNCKSDPAYTDALLKMLELEPTAARARRVAQFFHSSGQKAKAMKYYEQSLGLETDRTKKSKVYMTLAALERNKVKGLTVAVAKKARSYAKKAAELNPSWGKPYLFIGGLYASSGPLCGPGRGWKSQIVTWPATDMWEKAKDVDPSVSGEANKSINNYAQYYPTTQDGFMNNVKNGQKFKVPCWINTTTRARLRKE